MPTKIFIRNYVSTEYRATRQRLEADKTAKPDVSYVIEEYKKNVIVHWSLHVHCAKQRGERHQSQKEIISTGCKPDGLRVELRIRIPSRFTTSKGALIKIISFSVVPFVRRAPQIHSQDLRINENSNPAETIPKGDHQAQRALLCLSALMTERLI